MTIFNVGRATIVRVEEVYGATYRATDIFPDLTKELVDLHAPWLAPHHYEAETGLIKLSVHSWLLRIGSQKMDRCHCGNQKTSPAGRSGMMNTNYLERACRRPAGRDRPRHARTAPRSRRLEHAAPGRKLRRPSQRAMSFQARL